MRSLGRGSTAAAADYFEVSNEMNVIIVSRAIPNDELAYSCIPEPERISDATRNRV